jgi:Phage tail assembly chaperone proteins, E, or 41 or 14
MNSALETTNGHPAGVPAADAFPRVLDLEIDPPVEAGQIYSTMHLREPTFQEVRTAETEMVRDAFGRATDGSTRAYQLALISKVSGVPRQAIDQMRISQVDQAFLFLISFRPPGPATGEI